MANSADPDQLASDLDLHCLQRQGISGFSRIRVKKFFVKVHLCFFLLLLFLVKMSFVSHVYNSFYIHLYTVPEIFLVCHFIESVVY